MPLRPGLTTGNLAALTFNVNPEYSPDVDVYACSNVTAYPISIGKTRGVALITGGVCLVGFCSDHCGSVCDADCEGTYCATGDCLNVCNDYCGGEHCHDVCLSWHVDWICGSHCNSHCAAPHCHSQHCVSVCETNHCSGSFCTSECISAYCSPFCPGFYVALDQVSTTWQDLIESKNGELTKDEFWQLLTDVGLDTKYNLEFDKMTAAVALKWSKDLIMLKEGTTDAEFQKIVDAHTFGDTSSIDPNDLNPYFQSAAATWGDAAINFVRSDDAYTTVTTISPILSKIVADESNFHQFVCLVKCGQYDAAMSLVGITEAELNTMMTDLSSIAQNLGPGIRDGFCPKIIDKFPCGDENTETLLTAIAEGVLTSDDYQKLKTLSYVMEQLSDRANWDLFVAGTAPAFMQTMSDPNCFIACAIIAILVCIIVCLLVALIAPGPRLIEFVMLFFFCFAAGIMICMFVCG